MWRDLVSQIIVMLVLRGAKLCAQYEFLSLEGTVMKGKKPAELAPEAVGRGVVELVNLNIDEDGVLALRDLGLDYMHVPFLEQGLEGNPEITAVDFSNNLLANGGTNKLVKVLSKFPRIRDVNLSGNRITAPGGHALLEYIAPVDPNRKEPFVVRSIFNLPPRKLDLSNNGFLDSALPELVSACLEKEVKLNLGTTEQGRPQQRGRTLPELRALGEWESVTQAATCGSRLMGVCILLCAVAFSPSTR